MTFAKSNKKKIFFGPNLIDNVNKELERKIINQINPNKLFVVNNKIKTKSLELYGLLDSDVKEVIVGPDTDIWKPPSDYSNNILWKGNSNHMVKDVDLALDISKRLDKYNFTFFGYPKPYSYAEHIDIARKSYLYFTTSISETKGMAVLEQFAAGVPCITHKNIFQAGISYKTGIIVKRDIDSYCSAIEEIMEDSDLRCKMSKFAVNYVKDLYNPSKLIKNVVKYYKE
jgi:glycosyltransferase involved in cell wall biosynthesis